MTLALLDRASAISLLFDKPPITTSFQKSQTTITSKSVKGLGTDRLKLPMRAGRSVVRAGRCLTFKLVDFARKIAQFFLSAITTSPPKVFINGNS